MVFHDYECVARIAEHVGVLELEWSRWTQVYSQKLVVLGVQSFVDIVRPEPAVRRFDNDRHVVSGIAWCPRTQDQMVSPVIRPGIVFVDNVNILDGYNTVVKRIQLGLLFFEIVQSMITR